MHAFPSFPGAPVAVPSPPADLWCWIRGDDRGRLILRADQIKALLDDAFECVDETDAFRHGSGRDLTGYEDGTENPTVQDAIDTAFVANAPQGIEGSSFVAIQKWSHDLQLFNPLPARERDEVMGRHIRDNSEMDDAPKCAHVNLTRKLRPRSDASSPINGLVRRSGQGPEFCRIWL
jgi:putative iron-dependent peroxidase